MYWLYSILLVIWGVLLLPAFLYKSWRRHRGFPGFSQRFGRLPETVHSDGRDTIWFHACSVGETLSLQSLVRALHIRFPEMRFVFSTITQTGQEIAMERFAIYGEGNTFYFPIDIASIVNRVLDRIRPSIVIMVDTEIWPNLIHQAKRRGIPVVLVNGRISKDSFRYYRLGRAFFKRVFPNYRSLMMQSRSDADRIRSMGAPADKISVTGNIKFDGAEFEENSGAALTNDIGKDLGLQDPNRVDSRDPAENHLIVAGSTHPNEEALLLEVLQSLRTDSEQQRTRLILAPRHPERFDTVAQLVVQSGFTLKRRSDKGSANRDADIYVLDSMGELAAVYRYATIVFVGGTLIRHGGHSIMEPALCSKAIVVGPSMDNFQTILQEFLSRNAIVQISAGSENRQEQVRQLTEAFRQLLQNPERRKAIGLAGRAVLDRNRGAVQQTVRTIDSIYRED